MKNEGIKIKMKVTFLALIMGFMLISSSVFCISPKLEITSQSTGHISSGDTLMPDNKFRDNDRVAFIGNSITHAGYYHNILYLYYATRFPGMTLDFFNCGVSGDRAMDAINRFDEDILENRPNVCIIKLGMNDAGIGLNGSLTEQLKGQALFKHDMDSLIGLCKTTRSRIVLLSPSIYDQTVNSPSNNLNKNSRLKVFALTLDSLSKKYGTGFLDLNSFMDSVNCSRQIGNPAFSLINADRTHPNYDGHFVMAYCFLNWQIHSEQVSFFSVNSTTLLTDKMDNCVVTGISRNNNTITFRCKENSLPFPVIAYPSDSTLVPFTKKFNQEILQVTGLTASDTYKLEINEQLVGAYTGSQFSKGINLAVLLTSPQSQQAYQIYKLNEERFRLILQLRDMKYVETKILKGTPIQGNLNEVMAQKLELDKPKPWFDYNKRLADFYLMNWNKKDQLKNEILQLEIKIRTINKPKEHTYKIYK